MENKTIADIFTEIADILDIQGENPFRVRSYRNAARTIEDMSQSLEALVKAGKNLEEIPGIGKSISEKIQEILSTGKCHFLEELQAKVPPGLTELLKLEGLGPKKVKGALRRIGRGLGRPPGEGRPGRASAGSSRDGFEDRRENPEVHRALPCRNGPVQAFRGVHVRRGPSRILEGCPGPEAAGPGGKLPPPAGDDRGPGHPGHLRQRVARSWTGSPDTGTWPRCSPRGRPSPASG